MTLLEALLLGIIQGLTEFFPVSSSGHLEIGQKILGMKNLNQFIPFNLVCHLGTLLAILCAFRRQIKRLLLTKWKQVICATLPLFPLLLILKPIKHMFDQPQYLGFFFLVTALVLYLGERYGHVIPKFELKKRRYQDALIIGTAQAMAILPGISRSGSTISAARLVGWEAKDAAFFSFLLAIPAILGGITLEGLQLLKQETPPAPISFGGYFVGFIVSFFVGYLALRGMMYIMERKKIMGFVWYCVMVGIVCLMLFTGA